MNTQDLKHLAYSIAHGTFDEGCGGCACELCQQLRDKIKELQQKEATEFYEEHYPPPGGFL